MVLGLAVVVGGYLWLNHEANPSGPKGAQVIVAVPKGAGVSSFAGPLQKDGIIGSSLAFRIWISIHGDPGVFAGSYAFNKNDSFGTVKRVLGNGPNVFDLMVEPGFTVSEVASRVGQFPGHDGTAFKQLADGGSLHSQWQPAGVTSLDGLLGTGSYRILPGESDTQLLTQMIDRFDSQANSMNLVAGSAALGLTPYQAVTMASIVQKEGVIQKNLGPVARVILNRLAKNTPLQMDSTVLYSEGRDGGTVTNADLQLQSPYNTYLHIGLTPTPICFPSPAALQAAAESARRVVAVLRIGAVGRDRSLLRYLRRAVGQPGHRQTTRARVATVAPKPNAGAGSRRDSVGGHHGGRRDRRPGGPLAVPVPPQCGLCRPRPGLGVGRLPGGGRRTPRPP